MKRITILLAAIALGLTGCRETTKEHSTGVKATSETQEQKSHVEPALTPDKSWTNEIVLNNGIKWSANTETTDGVRDMLKLITDSKTKTTIDYKNLGEALNNIKNTVVKECTMKGASHDNLHVWLHPLIEKIALLQKVENKKDGAQITSNLKEHLEAYYDYFE
ncbi:MAG: hypothetical protein WBM98_13055 [Maribacter sp.]|uniref:hypothetical protein n=1 Tax=Maribacter sp. TaxID=1897614 RepID=UPI003C793FDB